MIEFFDGPSKQFNTESRKFVIDCSTICDREIVPANTDNDNIHDFLFYFNIVTRGETRTQHKQFLIGMDDEDKFQEWLNALNTVIKVIRGEN